MRNHYDYIIAGAGCAGLSLLNAMMEHPFFAGKQILITDLSPKTQNDRTWCFWETGNGAFEPIITHRWKRANFFSPHFSAELDLTPYTYKMIRGIDLYRSVQQKASLHKNIDWLQEEILSVGTDAENSAYIDLASGRVSASFVFNSILFDPESVKQKAKHYLLQHFTGWLIETKHDDFDPSVLTYMDFRTQQANGTAFIYVLPVSATRALVEYTVFGTELLPTDDYENALRSYIQEQLQIADYSIIEKEHGIIPMTDFDFEQQSGRVINIGTAGGQVKPSTGYAFSSIQKHSAQIVQQLVNGKADFRQTNWRKKKFRLYDRVLLNVLQNKKMNGEKIFSSIFKKNAAGKVLAFLDNETGLRDDLAIMRSVPSSIFLPAALQEMIDLKK